MAVSVSVLLPERTVRALEELASASDCSKSSVIRKALEAYLAEYADYKVALDRLRARDAPVISVAELRKRLRRKV